MDQLNASERAALRIHGYSIHEPLPEESIGDWIERTDEYKEQLREQAEKALAGRGSRIEEFNTIQLYFKQERFTMQECQTKLRRVSADEQELRNRLAPFLDAPMDTEDEQEEAKWVLSEILGVFPKADPSRLSGSEQDTFLKDVAVRALKNYAVDLTDEDAQERVTGTTLEAPYMRWLVSMARKDLRPESVRDPNKNLEDTMSRFSAEVGPQLDIFLQGQPDLLRRRLEVFRFGMFGQ